LLEQPFRQLRQLRLLRTFLRTLRAFRWMETPLSSVNLY